MLPRLDQNPNRDRDGLKHHAAARFDRHVIVEGDHQMVQADGALGVGRNHGPVVGTAGKFFFSHAMRVASS